MCRVIPLSFLLIFCPLALFGDADRPAKIDKAGDDKKEAAVRPFRIKVDDAVLTDLKERLARTRFPDQLDEADWDYGVELSYLKDLVTYWRNKYDWRAWEKKLNAALPQFETEIDGVKIHFVHKRSRE